MAREFGLEFYQEKNGDIPEEYFVYDNLISDSDFIAKLSAAIDSGDTLYVRPDCHHFLAARINDLVRFKRNDSLSEFILIAGPLQLDRMREEVVLEEIIQRKGKAFFVPKIEEERVWKKLYQL